MKYEEIVRRVEELSGLRNVKDAESVLRAVLGTLGERIYRTEERQAAAQLPAELKDIFQEYQSPERGRGDLANYPVEEFYNRVKARAKVSFQESQRLTAIVLHVLKEAVSPGEIENVVRKLPADFQRLFEAKHFEVPEPVPVISEEQPEEFHVLPTTDNKWCVQRRDGEVLGTFDTKERAVVFADDHADAEKRDYLVIHNIDGSISKKMEPASRERTRK